jgi:hypothetical protein
MPEKESQPKQAPPTPRWVKVFGIIALIILLLAAIIIATDLGGEHGPGQHNPTGAQPGQPLALAGPDPLLSLPLCG